MSARPFDLTGQVALVTGAAGGIGAAVVAAFRQAGARVIASDRRPGDWGAGVEYLPAELDEAGAEALAARLPGPVDIFVHAAGIQGPAGPSGVADFDVVMQVNLRAAMILTSALAPGMAARGGGSIILIASIAALRGNRAIGLYGVSKAALVQHARNLAVEWGPHNLRANAISPGLIDTAFAGGLTNDADFMARRLALTPLRRIGRPQEVAAVALLLAGPGGGFITGQNIVVDGGTTIGDGS